MPKFAVATLDHLLVILREAPIDAGLQQDEWVSQKLASFANLLKNRPQHYRSFGLSWWPIKALLIERERFPFTMPDIDEVALVSFGSPELDVAAAYAYHEYSMYNAIWMNQHITVDTDDGDRVDYYLNDEEMEWGDLLGSNRIAITQDPVKAADRKLFRLVINGDFDISDLTIADQLISACERSECDPDMNELADLASHAYADAALLYDSELHGD